VLQPDGGEPPPPAFRQNADGALTALFPLIHGWSGAEPLCDEAHTLALARIDDEERLQRLRELLGNAAGLIHLAAACREWTTYWPSTTSPLLLCSPLRLPRLCNLADTASGQILHLIASPGDLIVASSSELPIVMTGGGGLNLADGGAAFLEQVEAQRAPDAPIPSGMVVEIR
jgi:hypothetical protein